MRMKKRTHPRRQARGCAQKCNHIVSQRRLSDEEWSATCDEMGPWLTAGIALATAFVIFSEMGVF